MNRHQQRIKLMIGIYQYLLIKKDINDIAEEIRTNDQMINEYFYDVLSNVFDHEEIMITKINDCLTEWDYHRLGYIEQAIMLLATVEILYLTYDKAVVIDEAVLLAKEYCDDDTYKLINGVLDRL
ncbi:MAG: transcription antitermination factor NusB [Erysipelotrichaceae bacterium]|nr:transcription antitermination factor NusB [Erysipelotrichaceae bacterium]